MINRSHASGGPRDLRDHIGVLLPPQSASVEELVALGIHAEQLGYRSVAAGEVDAWDATVVLGAIAARTRRIGLATSVLALPSRSIVQLAVAASTLADLCGGRFELGVGAGGRVIARWHDTDAPSAAALADAVTRLRRLLAGERDPDTRFRLAAAPSLPVPILVGALGPLAQRAALTLGDGLILTTRGTEAVAAARALAPPSGSTKVVAVQWVTAEQDDASARDALATAALPYLGLPGYDRVLDQAERARLADAVGRRDPEASKCLPAAVVDAVGVPGSADRVERRVQELLDAGADEVRLMPLGASLKPFAAVLTQIGA